ncbi:hypothetical protein ACFQ21_02535 [Ohtaekwangia kribbensis]|uniref:Uncharacterized protein n=1 Tax=Ohtaekwangia kribbensis TaxID=688913 RepID=A0ABW3JWF9_9BACT
MKYELGSIESLIKNEIVLRLESELEVREKLESFTNEVDRLRTVLRYNVINCGDAGLATRYVQAHQQGVLELLEFYSDKLGQDCMALYSDEPVDESLLLHKHIYLQLEDLLWA